MCDFVDKEIKENPDKKLSDILKVIFERCVSQVSGVVIGTDNMSCIIVQFLKDQNNSIDNKGNNIIAHKIVFGEKRLENVEIEVK